MIPFDCCTESFSTITYVIHLRRYPLFYFIYIFLPLISQLVLFLIIFQIPPDTGERLGFGITILLNITMYMILISEKLPEKSDKQPMLGLLFVSVFYLLSTGLATSAITMLLSRRTTNIPKILKRIFFTIKKKNRTRKQQQETKINNNQFYERSQVENNNNREFDVKYVGTGEMVNDVRSNEDNDEDHTVSTDESLDPNWYNLMAIFDKMFFYVFLILLMAIPFIIFLMLDKKGLMAF